MTTENVLRAVQDSGAPERSLDYTTLVILHGYVWHSAVFSRLIPMAKNYNTRLILVDRRDYPGSAPYTDEELAMIPSLPSDADEAIQVEARGKLEYFMKERIRELCDLLQDLVRRDRIPLAEPKRNTGGIIIAGWSFATTLMTAFLSYAPTFPPNNVELDKYVRRVICYDSGRTLGYPSSPGMYNALLDPSVSAEVRAAFFDSWASGYYSHGDALETLARKPLEHPPPTISTLTPDERARMMYRNPARDADLMLLNSAVVCGLFAALRIRALYPSGRRNGDEDEEAAGSNWSDVELRFIWCKKSVPEAACARMSLRSEMEDANEQRICVRPIKVVQVKNGNHFLHWDYPEWAMRAFVGEEDEI